MRGESIIKFTRQSQCLVFSGIVLAAIFGGSQAAAVQAQNAQFEGNLAGQAATMLGQNITSNVIGMNAIKDRGTAKIKSGKASTAFVYSPDIYRYMLDHVIFDETEPKTEVGRIKLLQEWMSKFEARMIKAGGYILHDNADATNFACILSYEAHHDRKMTPAQLVKFRQISQAGRQSYLDYAAYQGSPEQVKEKLYVWDAIRAIQAIEWREKARVAKTDAARREADREAKLYAKYRLIRDEELQ